MNVCRTLVAAVAILSMLACSKKNEDDDGKQTSSPSATAPASGAPTAEPKADAKPAIDPRVKAEVDGRADGITGAPAAVPGATAMLHTPAGWTATKGDPTTYASPDKKAMLAVSAFNPAEGPTPKLAAAATAFGLTACEWGPPEPLTVGKSKLAATGADGVCKRGTAIVRTAYVAPTAEKLLVIGAFDPDGDAAAVFGAMRAIAKVPAGDPLAACCSALRQNARSAPPDKAPYMIAAANMCDAMRATPQGRAQLAQLRAALRGANVPSSCR